MDFETLVKIIVVAVAAVGIPVGAYAAITATRAIWVKGEPGKADPALRQDVEAVESRLAVLEANRVRLAELEERLDFTERLLARQREPEQLG